MNQQETQEQQVLEDIEEEDLLITKEFFESRKINNYGTKDFYDALLSDEKNKIRMVRDIERIVRISFEGKNYRTYLSENIRIDRCTILSNIPTDKLKRVELHHHPLTLFEISKIVLEDALNWNYRLSPLLVAEKIIEHHYRNEIGLVPLAKTVHDLVHDGQIQIHPASIFGDWKKFIRRYKRYMDQETIARIFAKINWNVDKEAKNIRTLNPDLLEWAYEDSTLTVEDLIATPS